MVVDTVIAGGTLVTATGTFDAAVAIDDGRIAAVGDEDNLPATDDRVDASGLLVMPGVVDPHVHIAAVGPGDPYDVATGAAALGGVTTTITFAWQPFFHPDREWDHDGTLQEGIETELAAGEDAVVDFALHGGLTREEPATFDELDAAIDAGVTSFKMFTVYEEALSNGFIHRAFEEIAERDAVAVLHTEDPSVCDSLSDRFAAEERDPTWYPRSRPDYAEAMAADDLLRIADAVDVKYYGIHTSCRAAADVIERFRDDGSRVRGETCTQYTVLDDSLYADVGSVAKIAPPLRTPDDTDAMFEKLATGALDVVSTDHVAIDYETKTTDEWWEVAFGMNSIQVSLPIFHDEAVVERGFSYPFLVRVMCTNPAQTFGLPTKGTLEPGTDADIVLFDPNKTWTVDADDLVSTAGYSLYDGREVTGQVTETYVRGERVAADGEVVAAPGHGRYIERDLPDWDA